VRLKALSKSVTFLGSQVCTKAANAANLVSLYYNKMDYALNKTSNDQGKTEWLSQAKIDKQKIEKMKVEPITSKTDLNKAIEDYKLWLKQLYGKDFFTYKQTKE
jgi:hypothetical protein